MRADIEFNANVVEYGTNGRGNFVVLDKTFFYPDGKGGSIGDRGKISNSQVLAVEELKNKVLHYVDHLPDEELVHCEVDGERRQDLSVQHTAQHVLSQAFIRVANIETVSFHMGESISTIDLDCSDIPKSVIDASELLSNETILENRIVKKYFVNDEELEKLNLRKKIQIEGPIRIVEIDSFDISMCGGMHVNATGEIGTIKIIKIEHFTNSLVRVYYVAGKRAFFDYKRRMEILNSISHKLTTGEDDLANKITLLQDEESNLIKENKRLKEQLLKRTAKEIYDYSESINGINVSVYEFPEFSNDKSGILARFLQEYSDLASFVFVKNESLFILITVGLDINVDLASFEKSLQEATLGKVWENRRAIFINCKAEFLDDVKKLFLEILP
jgi:alanyl-tRNA synthetase